MQILVVDDDPVALKVLAVAVQKLGHDVVSATDGDEALETYRRVRPRVVLSDWCMPNMSGIELCERLRAEQNVTQPYVMLVTSLSARENTLEGFRAGADDYIVKPVDLEILDSRLRVAERIVSAQGATNELALREIVETCQSVVGPDHPALLESLRKLSNVYAEQNAFARARAFLRRQIAIAETSGDEATASQLRQALADIQAQEDRLVEVRA